jgi:pentatricopeptide repeat protein
VGRGRRHWNSFNKCNREGVEPDSVTLVGVLNACASIAALEEGRCAHEQIVERGWDSDVFIGNCLVDMYVKCGSTEDASRVFNKIPSHNVVTWNMMLFGHVKCGERERALEPFQQMQQEGVQPDPVTFVGVLNACAVTLEEGRCAHEQIIRSGFESDSFVGSSLVNIYVKCGSIEDARSVFNKMPSRNVVSWNAMLEGFAMHQHGNKALDHFEWMCQEGVEPDDITFISLLSACSHAGLVDEGMCYYDSMNKIYITFSCFIVSQLQETGDCIWACQHSSWCATLHNQRICRFLLTATITSMKFILKIVGREIIAGTTFITLRMGFALHGY